MWNQHQDLPRKSNTWRAEEVAITRLRIGHIKATKSHILSGGPPTTCQHCSQTLTIEHVLLEYTVWQRSRDEYYTAGSLFTMQIWSLSWIPISNRRFKSSGMCLYMEEISILKPTLGPPRKFKHLTRAEEVVITRLRIGHTKATKSHILSRGPPTACQHCGQTLTVEHVLLECTVLQQIRDEYYTAESLRALFETIPEACIVEFLREAGFFYLIWRAIHSIQHIIRITHQLTKFGSYINHHTLTTPLHSVIRLQSINSWENPTCERWLICLWGRVSSLKQMQSNPIHWGPSSRQSPGLV